MSVDIPRRPLEGAKALVVGIPNQHSIAYGCARAFRELGADLAITYVNEKTRTFVEPLLKDLEAPIFMPLDVGTPGMLEAVFDRIAREWGRLDIALHSIAFAPKEDLRGPLIDCSAKASSRRWTSPALLRAHVAVGGAVDEGRRDAVRDELLRRRQGRSQLQRDGPGKGGFGSVLPLSRV